MRVAVDSKQKKILVIYSVYTQSTDNNRHIEKGDKSKTLAKTRKCD